MGACGMLVRNQRTTIVVSPLFTGTAVLTARRAELLVDPLMRRKRPACRGMREMAHEASPKPPLMKEAHMFEHLNTPEELFSFKLGSALKMEQELVKRPRGVRGARAAA